MPVDDFDIELEKAEQQAKKPVTPPKPAATSQTGQQQASDSGQAAAPAQESSGPRQRPAAQAMSARRPGIFARAGDRLAQAFARVHLPRLDAVTILYGLLALIIFALLAENWSPVRINIFGVYIDVPKAVAFVVNLALGMLLLWIIQRYQRRSSAQAEGGRR